MRREKSEKKYFNLFLNLKYENVTMQKRKKEALIQCSK